MLYSELTVRCLEYLAKADGAHARPYKPAWIQDLVKAIREKDTTVTPRLLNLAIEELCKEGLVKVSDTQGADNTIMYVELDITGAGLRFLESLRLQAKKEGQSSSWMWSMVEKAATVAQLISLALQAAGKG